MADPLDLTGEITEAVTGAALRGHPLVIGYVDEDGYPALSFRGSAQVYGPQQLAVWARKRDDGVAKTVTTNPKVSVVYYGPEGPGPKFLSMRGTARVDESANDAVYAGMVEMEQQADAERKGVAVIIDVESVMGFASGGPFQMQR
jgi:hypothetical protein